jgi:hypothetical protein
MTGCDDPCPQNDGPPPSERGTATEQLSVQITTVSEVNDDDAA